MSAAKRKKTEIRDTIENRDRIHMVMVLLTVLFIAFSVGILICIGHIQAPPRSMTSTWTAPSARASSWRWT